SRAAPRRRSKLANAFAVHGFRHVLTKLCPILISPARLRIDIHLEQACSLVGSKVANLNSVEAMKPRVRALVLRARGDADFRVIEELGDEAQRCLAPSLGDVTPRTVAQQLHPQSDVDAHCGLLKSCPSSRLTPVTHEMSEANLGTTPIRAFRGHGYLVQLRDQQLQRLGGVQIPQM